MLTLHVSGGSSDFMESFESFGFGVDSVLKYDVDEVTKSISKCYAMVFVLEDFGPGLCHQCYDIGTAVAHDRRVFVTNGASQPNRPLLSLIPVHKNITLCVDASDLQKKLISSLLTNLEFKNTTNTTTDVATDTNEAK